MGDPTSANVPALEEVNPGIGSCELRSSAKRSAVGERQIFPVQINSTCRTDSDDFFVMWTGSV
jgi:hypothetical protein